MVVVTGINSAGKEKEIRGALFRIVVDGIIQVPLALIT
jgi:hypothetical protein